MLQQKKHFSFNHLIDGRVMRKSANFKLKGALNPNSGVHNLFAVIGRTTYIALKYGRQ